METRNYFASKGARLMHLTGGSSAGGVGTLSVTTRRSDGQSRKAFNCRVNEQAVTGHDGNC